MPTDQPTPDWRNDPLENTNPVRVEGNIRDHQPADVTPEFWKTADAVISAGHTCQSVLVRLDARLTKTPPGAGRDNLLNFRKQLLEKINNAQ